MRISRPAIQVIKFFQIFYRNFQNISTSIAVIFRCSDFPYFVHRICSHFFVQYFLDFLLNLGKFANIFVLRNILLTN